jgi:hypothetical protein
MAGELVQFPVQQVERHAGSVEQVAGAMETARSAVRDVTMDSGAYGILCQFLPGILTPVFERGADALYSSVDALHETAASLRRTATGMFGTDEASGNHITKAGHPTIDLPL